MDVKDFTKLRPYLYHLSAASNIPRIRQSRRLRSTTELLEEAGQMSLNSQRRSGLLTIQTSAGEVVLRDQDPLHARNIEFENGWDLARVIELLNARVFFWPGGEAGPIPLGQSHFGRYEKEGKPIAILRVPTSSLLDANPDTPPQFCKYNSGAPGSRGGPKSPRGSTTFQEADAWSFTPGKVQEVTFVGSVLLPDDTQVRENTASPWSAL